MISYPDSVRYLYSLGNEVRTIKLGLDRIRAFLAELGDPQNGFRAVHVAGTNGKGSVSAMVASGLRAAGERIGLYTSPHLAEPTERIRINGEPVKTEQFVAAFERVQQAAGAMQRRGDLDAHPTYFETITAMGFLLFHELSVDIAVIETGLGGRLDATNVLEPALSVLTRIDYDHERYLGSSLDAIVGEKAGILKPGIPAVFAPQRPEALRVLRQRAVERNVPVSEADDWQIDNLIVERDHSRFAAHRGSVEIPVQCPLAGAHQVENALTAVSALVELGLTPKAIRAGIAQTVWPGRLERMQERPEIVLDGAHNPAGIRALAAHIRRFYGGRRVWLVYGAMRDKSLDEIAGILSPIADHVILTRVASHRALRPAALRPMFDHDSVELTDTLPTAVERLSKAAPEVVIFVTGSLLLVGDIRKLLVG